MVARGTRCHVRRPRHPPGFRGAHGDRAQVRHSRQPFADLIQAFVQDQTVARYRDWDELFGYCRYSANPVGRLVLHLCGYSDPRRQRLSDATCTALQLANFWQDVTVDLLQDRVYIPLDVMARHGYTVEELCARRFTPAFRAVMREIVDQARALFLEGLPLSRMVDRRLALDLDCSAAEACGCCKKSNGGITTCSPPGPPFRRRSACACCSHRWRAWPSPGGPMNAVEQSYQYCRRVARTRAKNFYYSFLLLTAQQRKAMCAIYAFMRYCDDLSDEPGASRAAIERWRSELEDALQGRFSGHPVWPAFHHTVRRFGIPHDYFRAMIDGVLSDLEPRRFETFDQLRRYCYQVASVVGLTTIYIFGFDTPPPCRWPKSAASPSN